MEIVVLANRYKVHHFRSLEDRFRGRFCYEPSYRIADVLSHDPRLVICFDEHYCELGHLVAELRSRGVATLQVMDGILEWRRTWDYTREGHRIDGTVNPINQPVLSDKVACLGRRDVRILESWGNFGKCEMIGAPRLDGLLAKRAAGTFQKVRPGGRKPRVLVMTAKTPGFTEQQMATTKRSLRDLRDFFGARNNVDVVWRLTSDLDAELGIENRLKDLTGGDLHAVLEEVDAVVTTPSTSLLEAMLMDRPVALIDYHNCPHYFETAWSIYCREHVGPVVDDLLAPPPPRMDYQAYLLDEQLAVRSPAGDRMERLIEGMLAVRTPTRGDVPAYPVRMLDDLELFVTSPLPLGDFKRRYPEFPVPDDMPVREMKLELAAARGTIRELQDRMARWERRWERIPGLGILRKLRKALRGR